ncbi:transcriptional regulator, TetR family [Pseudidiomarina planktonica]|uniref:Transcriptional regulator, TetR family n=1 Tax=Pseudidiomarina planktonica TaxID=1323738 RepID=A0A1Y6EK35_9GAMM|nr:TetR/AcrR family transcriptional regulator [Pseudidiomarina planktonica]SMQ60523.1 transcriptional regulator, TetR family [Pseudidiomarina planktonica]
MSMVSSAKSASATTDNNVVTSKQPDKCGRPSLREHVLDAAEALVAEQGAARLTFDALVQQTGVSKGGLLYHFANKDALVQAMLQRLVDRKEVRRTEFLKDLEGSRDANLKSILLAAMSCEEEAPALHSAILAAAANNPELLAPLREQTDALFAELDESELGGERARLLLFAVHGARLFEQLGLCQYGCCDRERFAEVLLGLVDDLGQTAK